MCVGTSLHWEVAEESDYGHGAAALQAWCQSCDSRCWVEPSESADQENG